MNTAHLHLLLNHIPILGAFFGTVLLLVGLVRKNNTILTVSLWTFLIVALATSGAFFTGEGAEEIVENTVGVNESVIEAHEEASAVAFYAMILLGVISALLLLINRKKDIIFKSSLGVLLVAVLVNGLMFRSGWLGGKIKHDEIRGTVSAAAATGNNTDTGGAESDEKKDDD